MRVLATVERYLPAIGGAERVVQRVAEGLAERGHEVSVFTGGSRSSQIIEGVRVERFPLGGNAVRGISGPIDAVLAAADDLQPDLIFNYAAQSWPTDVFMTLLERPERPAMVLAPCGFSALGNPRYAQYFRSLRERLPRYEAVITHSAIYQDHAFALDAGLDSSLHVIANGADDPPEHCELKARLGVSGPLVATVSSHVRSKGHTRAIAVMKALARSNGARGVVVAPPRTGLDGLRGCQLSCSLRTAGRRSVTLLDGSLPLLAAEAIAAADVFLLASRVECAPLVIIESMAAGTPWVSYAVGNVSELDGGIPVEPGGDLLSACRQVLEGSTGELGRRGHAAWAANHRWPAIIERYEEVFRHAVNTVTA